ncbi:TPA: hypothetical protein N0F65_010939 [Lagenidium giganteum]|uniref:Laminin IV type A domain-containing protein n=1 Tax=Lagenidium giganteum TaxID=4803 RepID=A0AAV2Z0Y1_9STRA|nr:TPA: hypothetical protein N0F65_010939 [Lagenidium giganteum]
MIPIARHLVYHVPAGQEAVIALKGFNLDGRPLQATITQLPLNGQVYQLSQVYSLYGYDPKKDTNPITTVPSAVTGSKNRVVFARPQFGGPPINCKFAEFRYTLTNGVDVSKEGIVFITTDEALMTSTFNVDTEGWTIGLNGKATTPTYQPVSRGNLLSYYIYATDAVIHRNDVGDDTTRWYFYAPPKFLGNQWAAYGGSLDFVLFSSEGSFDLANLNLGGTDNLVVLECATCAMNTGITLAMPLSYMFKFDGSVTQFRLPLDERMGWLKDPKNVLVAWAPPTMCEMVSVLSALSGIRILGDFTRGYETVALDSVTLRHGPGQPVACYP